MMQRARDFLAAGVFALILMAAQTAGAVDAPRWVAALHIAAQNAVGLRWTPAAGATGYKVLRSTTQGSGYAEIASTAQPQHFDTDLEPGTTYYYVLQAVAGAEASPNSEEKSVAIPGEKKKDVLLPPTMRDLTLTQTTEFGKTVSKVGVFWQPPKGTVVAYNVYRSTTSGKDYQMVTSSAEAQFVDADVEIGKTYYYVVSALDGSFQETPYSPEKSVTIAEPEKKVVKVRKEKVKISLRRAKLIKEIYDGPWGKLEQPTALVINSRNELFIVDGLYGKVFVFNAQNFEFLFTFAEKGAGEQQLQIPIDMAIDDEDRLWINDIGKRAIIIFNSEGQYQKSIKIEDLFDDGEKHGNSGVYCATDYWYLSDDQAHKVHQFEYGSNKLVASFGGLGKEANSLRGPSKPYFSAKEGVLVVPDTFNFRVQILRDMEAERSFGTYGNSVTQFSRVLHAVDDDMGNLITVDFGNQTTQAFGFDGDFKYVLGTADGTEQIHMTGATHIFVQGKRAFICNKLQATVAVWEMTDEIGPMVKKAKK